jgi:hypothetical protein
VTDGWFEGKRVVPMMTPEAIVTVGLDGALISTTGAEKAWFMDEQSKRSLNSEKY